MTQDVTADDVRNDITTSTADLEEVRTCLAVWLTERLGSDGPVEVVGIRRPESSGMSSISVLVDAQWTVDGEIRRADLVARLAPEATSFPVFPGYDLSAQAEVMRAVAARTGLPVPAVRWTEPSPDLLGVPFLVMDRVSGRVPVDNPPYVFGGWVLEGLDDAGRARLREASVEVLARIHATPDPRSALGSTAPAPGVDTLRAHVENERAYYEWTRREDGLRIPVLERAFEWIEAHWPSETSRDVLCWGDARIGNIMFDGTDPAAVLDWESATLAPPELDLGWFLFFHDQFQEIAEKWGFPGLPDLFPHDAVIGQYESLTGSTVRDLEFFRTYAALRHGIVMSQIERRRIHFGEVEPHEDPDEYVLHHEMLNRLISAD